MPKVKPTVLARQLWGARVAIEVKVDSGKELRSEIRSVRKALRSSAMSEIFVLVANGMYAPTEIAAKTGKSKFAVSLQLSSLRKMGLLSCRSVAGLDMRRKRYEVVWEKIARMFRQDHALEFDIYANHLMVEPLREIHGSASKPVLVISGDGKLGMIKEITPDAFSPGDSKQEEIGGRMNRILLEFVALFKGYLKERRFATIHEYILGAYEELSEHYARLPQSSELAQFFEFMDRTFTRTRPIDDIWARYASELSNDSNILFKGRLSRKVIVKLFTEAGSADPAGRYVLNADAQAIIKPGTLLRIYPSYTYPER